MFKHSSKNLDSDPCTPKITTVPLPVVNIGAHASVLAPRPKDRISKVRWRADSPDSLSDGELLACRRQSSVATSGVRSSTPAPTRTRADHESVRHVGSRCAPRSTLSMQLHWQLLPFDLRRSKARIQFDIAHVVDRIRFQTAYNSRPLTPAELDKPVASAHMSHMSILCEDLPNWPVTIERAEGIRCLDVFVAIYNAFHHSLTESDRKVVGKERLSGCEEAFKRRCQRTHKMTAMEEAKGMRRVDLLAGKTWFKGLMVPPPTQEQSSWILKLGWSE